MKTCAVTVVLAASLTAIALQSQTQVWAPGTSTANGILWLIFVDDLHISFVETGRLRDLLRVLAREVIHDGDASSVHSSGASSPATEITSDLGSLGDTFRKATGNALKPSDILQGVRSGSQEVAYRAQESLTRATQMVSSLAPRHAGRTAFIYVGNGFVAPAGGPAALGDRLSALTRLATASGVRIYAIDTSNLHTSLEPDPAVDAAAWQSYQATARGSLKALAEPTGGFVVADLADRQAAARSIRIDRLALAGSPTALALHQPHVRAQPAPAADGVLWLLFVDDLHINFTDTFVLRQLLKTVVAELVHDWDAVSLRTSGDSRPSTEVFTDRVPLAAEFEKITGNGHRPGAALRIGSSPAERREQRERALETLRLATMTIESRADLHGGRKALIYVGNGFEASSDSDAGGVRERLSALTRKAVDAGVRVFAIDTSGLAGPTQRPSAIDPVVWQDYWTARRDGLRALTEPTGGFAITEYGDQEAAARSIRIETLR